MNFHWENTEYSIRPDVGGLNLVVERLIQGPGPGKSRDQLHHRGRTTYHPTLAMALRCIAQEGCRQIGALSINQTLTRLEEIENQFEKAILDSQKKREATLQANTTATIRQPIRG